MARERMVTRTVYLNVVEVMTVNTTTASVRNITVEIGGTLSTDTDILKAVKKQHETDTLKCVALVSVTAKEVLYGMSESEFIRLANVLPPRSKTDSE